MFEIKNLSISIQDRYLVRDLSFTLNKGDKLALIGEVGNGKSTLLKALLGSCTYAQVKGFIHSKGNKIGYLEQTMNDIDSKKKVYDFLFQNHSDYYNNINNFYQYLNLMQLTDSILEQKMDTVSGGENVKIRLLKLLLEENDILFLDEPSSDLEIETLEWLEQFINQTTQPVLYISHDETLLSKTANRILHLEQIQNKTDCRHTLLKIDYNSYVEKRNQAIKKQVQIARYEKKEFQKKQNKLRNIMQKVEYQQNTISRKDPHGAKLLKKKMHSLKSQEKKLDHISLTELPDIEDDIYFFFEQVNIPKSKLILSLEISELKIKNRILFKNIKLDIIGNSHICIIGKNGVGKSTLLKEIKKQMGKKDHLKVGYMPQNYEEILDPEMTVIDFIALSSTKEDITKSRKYLGSVNFTKEEMMGKMKHLSNGTKAKLILIKFVLEQCQVLILDEPTRNMSPISNPRIRQVLKNYTGTIISVSHDRKYIEELGDHLYLLTEDGLIKKR